ncbi:MAG TPA: sigma-54 dependent transcriptional regulator [Terriglobales bacterium]|nr:sigma-54 dependent transcriptional regulator [Terriglobales bacterium]
MSVESIPFPNAAGREVILASHSSAAVPVASALIGQSPALLEVLDLARQISATSADILIQAESGTGKELLARYIHDCSAQRNRAFVAVNCAAVPEALLESELFGHARGAYTGAIDARPGKFEIANGGTLLLDEIGEMPLSLQPKLLRVLQEREFMRLGDSRTVRVEVRVIATTNRCLEKVVEEGDFRADLYYRLNVIPLTLPPLRARRSDIPLLADHFRLRYGGVGRRAEKRFSSEFLERLSQHSWPGNVRELENVIRRALVLSPGPEIGVEALRGREFQLGSAPEDALRAGLSLRDAEKRLLELTLEATSGNRSLTAKMLGVSIRTVRNKIRDYQLARRYA